MDIKELKKLNFMNLLTLDTDIKKYTYENYAENKYEHTKIIKMCTLCEKEKVNICTYNHNYKLKTMGHGTMTDDILIATGQRDKDLPDWKNEGVVFLLENPGPCDPNIYKQVEYIEDNNKYKKFPTYRWYWLNQRSVKQRNLEKCEYPKNFRGNKYVEFFTSVLFTFKLNNMYITDFIKCGLDDVRYDFKGDRKDITYEKKYNKIEKYENRCIENCLEHYLYKEIQLVNPKIIFCLGSELFSKIKIKDKYIYDKIKKQVKHNEIIIKRLPHPAYPTSRSKKFSPENIQYINYKVIFDGLCESGIISAKDEKEYYEKKGNIKFDEIKEFLDDDGFTMKKQHNNIK